MENLIPIISKLQDVFAVVGSRESKVQLPQIVVVGSQSAGKSSVIEGIVGRDFLPRGSDIVTRRPLLIHLIHKAQEDTDRKSENDWATFEHVPNKIYTDFEQVREEIEAETNRSIGTNKGVSDKSIILKIYSANVLDLSLIDLPGITKNPVGDQPADIEEIVRKMILLYIENPQSLILAVTPANQDIANSDALKLAREVDEEGDRTLCVLTKLDIMDRGTDAQRVMRGEIIKVKLGIIGVINRSQADIVANKSIADCLNDEMAFLSQHYPALASKHGIKHLAKVLHKRLLLHIQASLPQLKNRIKKMSDEYQAEMEVLGSPVEDKKKTFMQIITRFSSAYIATIDGSNKNIGSSKLCGGAKISAIFYDELERNIEKIHSMGDLSVEEVLSSIKNGSGLKPAMFIPERPFETLVKKQMKRFKAPMLECVDLVYDELIGIINNCGNDIKNEMDRFPILCVQIRKVVSAILDTRKIKTVEYLEDYLETELAFINTKHPEFIINEDLIKAFNENANISLSKFGTAGAAASKLLSTYTGDLTSREKRDFCIIEHLIDQYFSIVQKSIKDKVPKAIIKFLINYIIDNIHTELFEKIYDPANLDDLLEESGNMIQRRNETAEMLKALKNGNDILKAVRDFDIL